MHTFAKRPHGFSVVLTFGCPLTFVGGLASAGRHGVRSAPPAEALSFPQGRPATRRDEHHSRPSKCTTAVAGASFAHHAPYTESLS
jgi:hypothetical protein